MPTPTFLQIDDTGTLALSKDTPELQVFRELFEAILQSETLVITNATEDNPGTGTVVISGVSNTWGSAATQINIEYLDATGQISEIALVKPVLSFAGLDLTQKGNSEEALLSEVSFDQLEISLFVVAPEADANLGPELQKGIMSHSLEGQLKIGADTSLAFKIDDPGTAGQFSLEFLLGQSQLPGFSQLATLFGHADNPNADLDWLPGELKVKPFELDDLKLSIDKRDPYELTQIDARLAVLPDQAWTILPDLLSVKGLWFELDIEHPLDPESRFPRVSAGGTVHFGADPANGNVLITARWPDYSIEGQLAENNTIPIGAMFDHLQLANTGDTGLGQMVISKLWFLAEPIGEVKTFSFLIVIDEAWQLEIRNKPAFEIKELLLSLDYSNQPGVGSSGRFDGKFIIAGVEVDLSTSYDTQSGWQFEGSTGPGQSIPVGTLLQELGAKFEVQRPLPGPLKDLTIRNLRVSFNSKTKNFSFGCEGDFPVEGKDVAATVNVKFTKKEDGAYQKDFDGLIEVGPFDSVGYLQFELHFIQNTDSALFAATYKAEGEVLSISLQQLIGHFTNNVPDIPADLTVGLKDIILVFDKSNGTNRFLFALDIGAKANLSKLPLVGKEFPPDKSVGFDKLQFLLATAPIQQTETQNWISQNLLPQGITLPNRDLPKGLGIDGTLNLGGLQSPVNLPITAPDPQSAGEGQADTPGGLPQTATPPGSSDKAKWFTIQKKIGPVDFERVGLQYDKGALWFLLDASLTAAGLAISLQGLTVGSPLNEFKPKFDLIGLGIDYKNGPLEIGGAFLKFGENEYDGTAIIKTEALSLAAIGSYAIMADGHKLLFIYAVLDYPLGGPAFFFVTGLAAGFGYNRRLRVPAIGQVDAFPLVAEAVNGTTPIPSGTGQRTALANELNKLRTYIPPEEGQYFLAIGIKFNSLKIVDSFALLTVSFGNQFELDLLGLSTMVAPTAEAEQAIDPLAEVQMAIKASFIPDEGFLGLEAQLTSNSFILSRKCRLTGGFAFYSWMAGPHKGDFVISLGGYHPSYQVPAHYPKVPRLGFNWQVTPQLSLKGGIYFALTASAMMAGGRLEALWLDGNLRAWFIAGADFLIAWKPYHYDAQIYVDMGVSYTFHFFGAHTISVDVGAGLHIWGPDFSGKAHIKLWIVTFDVSFGAGASQQPRPVSWATFRSSFLPASDKDIAGISLVSGAKTQPGADSGVDWVIDMKHFEFEAHSQIPIKRGHGSAGGNQEFGIGPMNLKSDQVDSSLAISIKKSASSVNTTDSDVTYAFSFEPILKDMPVGVWGTSINPSLNGQKFIKGALAGYRIKLAKQEQEPEENPVPIDRHKFMFAVTPKDNYIRRGDLPCFYPDSHDDWRSQLKADLSENASRDTLLNALGFAPETEVQLSDTYVNELILSPQFAGQEPV